MIAIIFIGIVGSLYVLIQHSRRVDQAYDAYGPHAARARREGWVRYEGRPLDPGCEED